MNLRRLARCIVSLWLPLAVLQSHSKSKLNNRIQNEKNLLFMVEDEKKNVMENMEEKMEEKFVKALLDKHSQEKSVVSDSRASGKFSIKNSANVYLQKWSNPFIVKNKISAHAFMDSLSKDTSALIVNSGERSKRNVHVLVKVNGRKRSKRKHLRNPLRTKREISKNVSVKPESEVTTSAEDYEEEEIHESKNVNDTEMGSYLGAPCELTCSDKLLHVFCDPTHRVCECEEKYPVQIGVARGCEKPKQLGDQCFYAQTCSFFDPNAVCTQINHNAICQCKPGFHTVALRKGVKRMFCSEDIAVVSADLPTLLGVATGIAVLTGLLCFVLRLFSGNRYPPARHYGNANLAPPLLLSSDNQWINGIPLTVHGRPSSRSSCQRSTTSLAQYSRNKGVLVPASRAGAARAAAILLIPCHLQASRHSDSEVVNTSNNDDTDVQENDVEQSSRSGSRRPSISSVHSTTSSQKSNSYSARRFEQENQQKEQRAAMRAAREEAARMTALPTPSPMSTDELLLIPSSSNNEEDLLCSSTAEPLAHSEPPALSIKKGNMMTPSARIMPVLKE